ncbi:unnamed protein product [Camellia sinensis]
MRWLAKAAETSDSYVHGSYHIYAVLVGLFLSITGGISYCLTRAGAKASDQPVVTVFSFGVFASPASIICTFAFEWVLLDDLLVAEDLAAAETTSAASHAATATVASNVQAGRLPGRYVFADERTRQTIPDAVSDGSVVLASPRASPINGDMYTNISTENAMLQGSRVSAPGQPTIDDLVNLYNLRQIGPDTKVFGIIKKPVGHSKSPILYNEAFKEVGFDGVELSPDLFIYRFCWVQVQFC